MKKIASVFSRWFRDSHVGWAYAFIFITLVCAAAASIEQISVDPTTRATSQAVAFTGAFSVDSPTICVNITSDSVGIGTSIPAYRLDVNGDVNVVTGRMYKINGTNLAKGDIGLSSVENTALSTWAGTTNVTTLGTIGTGSWNATALPVNKGGTGAADTATAWTNLGILSAANHAEGYFSVAAGSSSITTVGTVTSGTWSGNTIAIAKGGTAATDTPTAWTNLGIGSAANHEDTYFAPAAGSANIVTLGTIGTGAWNATAIPVNKGGTGATDTSTAWTNLGIQSSATQATAYFATASTTPNISSGSLIAMPLTSAKKIGDIYIETGNADAYMCCVTGSDTTGWKKVNN